MKFRKMFTLSLFVTFFAWLAPVVAYSATYYVAKTGTNSYSCAQAQTESTPKVTIAGGLACMAAGDTLIVKNGTYHERIGHNQFVSGTPGAFTTVKAENAFGVTLVPPSTGPFGVWFYGKHYIVFDGFIVDGTNITSQGILINRNDSDLSSHITLRNIEVKNVKGRVGAQSSGTCIATSLSPNIQIINAKIHNCGLNDPGHSHGIYLSGANSLIEYSEIYDNYGHGIHQFHQSSSTASNNVIRYNYVHDNGSRGILIGNGQNNIAHHNIVARTKGTAAGITTGFSTSINNQIYNNVIYGNTSSGPCIDIRYSGSSWGAKVKNNLCLSNANNTIRDWGRGTVLAKNRLSTDSTLVVDVSTNRFSPREGSALIDAGENISGFSSGKFVGSTPDQGALEFTGVVTKPVPNVPNTPISLRVAP